MSERDAKRARNCAGCPLSDKQLIAEIGTFLMGGLETTAHTLSFTLYCIASNPKVQQHIVQELLTHNLIQDTGCEPSHLTFDHLAQLPYIDAVLKEAMRMYPVVAGFPRCISILCHCMITSSCQKAMS